MKNSGGRSSARPFCTACSRLPSAVLLKASEDVREPEGDLRDVLARCKTFSELERHSWTFTPAYFLSKTSTIGTESLRFKEV